MFKEYTTQLDKSINGDLSDSILNKLIQKTVEFIGQNVTWDDFESYVECKITLDSELLDCLHAQIFTFFQEAEESQKILSDGFLKLTFKDPKTTEAFYAFTQHTFPIIHSEYPKINSNEIELTTDQFYFCRRGAKLKTGQLSTDFLTDYFLKTLRADHLDFSDKFIKGIIPNTSGKRRLQNIRPTSRQPFTIMGDGSVISRTTKESSSPEKNNGFSQIQSCTYIDTKAMSSAFGFCKERESNLYGILTHRGDLQMSRLLLKDGGTVFRPFDAESTLPATLRSSNYRNPKEPYLFSPQEFEIFKAQNAKLRKNGDNTNEVLARMRFNPFRSMVCICSDTDEARLLALDFSQELLEHYAEYANSHGYLLNQKFRLPIVFYLRKPPASYATTLINKLLGTESGHDISNYTQSRQKKDFQAAENAHKSTALKANYYSKRNFEHLLGLQTITPEILLEPINGVSLAIMMMRNGYTRMLMRLLRPSRKNTEQRALGAPSVSDVIFDSLLDSGQISQNDVIISNIIMEEQFTLADKLIARTNSNKQLLEIEENSEKRVLRFKLCDKKPLKLKLTEYIASRGNPRHFNYMGIDEMLKLAACHNFWVTIKLCLKEFTNISRTTIDHIFLLTCVRNDRCKDPDIVFLLKRIGVSASFVEKEIYHAMSKHNWELAELLITHYQDQQIKLRLGFTLLVALRHKQHKLAIVILSKGASDPWRITSDQNYKLRSSLLYAIEHDFNDLLPPLYEHENTHQDQDSNARLGLAMDLARAKNNNTAMALFTEMKIDDKFIMLTNIKRSVCYYIFEALFANQPLIAEYRLSRFATQFDFPHTNSNFISTLKDFSEEFQSTLGYFEELTNNHDNIYITSFIECLTELSTKYQDISLLYLFKSLFQNINSPQPSFIEQIIIRVSLNSITSNTVEIIKSMISISNEAATWQREIVQTFEHVSKQQYTFSEMSSPLFDLILIITSITESTIINDSFVKMAFKHAVATSNNKLTHTILTETPLSDTLREELFSIAIEYSKAEFFKFLIMNYRFNLTDKQLYDSYRSMSYVKAILLLQEASKEQYRNIFSHWALFNLWIIGCLHYNEYPSLVDARKLLIGITGHHVAKHFTLVTLLIFFRQNHRSINLSLWPNLDALLTIKFINTNLFLYFPNHLGAQYELNGHHDELLGTLNHYFDGTDNIPDEHIITQTFEKVLLILKAAAPVSIKSYFFNDYHRGEFNHALYLHMKRIDELANIHRVTPFEHNSNDIQNTHNQIDAQFSQQTICV